MKPDLRYMDIKIVTDIEKTPFTPITEEAKGRQIYQASELGITAFLYANDDRMWMICPSVESKKPGSGNFDSFIQDLKHACMRMGYRLVFAGVVNQGVYRYLQKYQIPVLVNGALHDVYHITTDEAAMTDEERARFLRARMAARDLVRPEKEAVRVSLFGEVAKDWNEDELIEHFLLMED